MPSLSQQLEMSEPDAVNEPDVASEHSAGSSRGSRGAAVLNIVISGSGLLTDLYDFQVINNVKRLIQDAGHGPMTTSQESLVSCSALLGSVCGMLFFGMMADKVGRRSMFLATAALTLTGSILSACAWDNGHGLIYDLLIAFRFIMGFGIGGEYPISASHTAETSSSTQSAAAMASVYSCMGIGTILAPLVVYICLVAGASNEFTWRFAFGFGGLISFMVLVLRFWKMRNSDKYEAAVRQEEARPADQKRSALSVLRSYSKPLVGVCVAWFLYDVVDYGLGLYSDKLASIVTDTDAKGSVLNVLLMQSFTLPFWFVSVPLLSRLGRKQSLIFGTSGMMLMFLVICAFYPYLESEGHGWLFLVLYCIQLSFDYMAAGACMYVIPGEIFPTSIRATGYGLAAASGKLGAFVGVYLMPFFVASDDHAGWLGVRWTMLFMAGVSLIAILWAILFIPNYNAHTLEFLDAKYDQDDPSTAITWLYGGGVAEARKKSKESALL